MRLSNLEIDQFKNYEHYTAEFCKGVNVFTGLNGSGKTNLLDAIHYLALTKSFLNYTDRQNIRFEQSFFSIKGLFKQDDGEGLDINLVFNANDKKVVKKNNVPYERLADHIGLIPMVVVSPQDSTLITEGSEIRRRLLDTTLSQIDQSYLQELMKYNRALVQRNTLLKQAYSGAPVSSESLDIWDSILVTTGTPIFKQREAFLSKIIPQVQKHYKTLSSARETINLVYESSLHEGDFLSQLQNQHTIDLKKQYTTTGIHRDDVGFYLNDKPIKKYGSQGQQKSFLLALKYTLFNYLKQQKKTTPILLLDDIFDKLDYQRVKSLMDMLSKNTSAQIFITDTERDRIEPILQELNLEHKIFELNHG